MRKDDLNVHVFQNRNWGPFHRKGFKWKKYGVTGLVSEKNKLCMQNLTKECKQPPVVTLQMGKFLQYIYSVLVAKNH